MIAIEQETWFTIARRVKNPRLRLFCFAHAGGSASLFQRWHRELPSDVEVVGVQMAGRGTRRSEPPAADLQAVLDNLLPAMRPLLDRPYVLFGHSMGALIAFEAAMRLQERSGTDLQHLILAAGRPPHEASKIRPMHTLSRNGLVRSLRNLAALPTELLHDDTFLDAVLPVLRADFQLVETWNHEASASLRMPVTVIGGESDPLVDREMLLGWRLYTSGEFDLIEMEGDHFFPFNRQQEFLAALSRVLSAALKFGPMN